MIRHLIILLAVLISVPASAGYYARLTEYTPTMQYTKFGENTVSTCYLTPSMAIAGLGASSGYYVVTALSDGAWSVKGTTAGGGYASGIYAECSGPSNVYAMPPMEGGVSDPAIVGGSIIDGNGGGGYDPTLLNALHDEVNALQIANTQMALELAKVGAAQNAPFELSTALGGTAFAFSTVLFFFGISKGIGQVLEIIRKG